VAKIIQAIRGMNDILPEQTGLWQFVEQVSRQVFAAYGYAEIRFPLVEKTELFKRAIGEVTDIVEKEMYTFTDRNGDSLTLRPEGTACCVRAGIQNGLLYNQIQRLWYCGAMFRHERPQKGRYRQFHQIGAEAYGLPDIDIEAEMLLMTARLWRRLGLKQIKLQINSLGSLACRARYKARLVAYFGAHQNQLDDDSLRRLTTNPLRILDSKNPKMQNLCQAAPRLWDDFSDASQQRFTQLQNLLHQHHIEFELNPRLVRGLDYYNHTVFEWVTDRLGAQGTVCAGGRYDGLVEQIGGKATPAFGFALGMERLLALLQLDETLPPTAIDAYFITLGDVAEQHGLLWAEKLRQALPYLHLLYHCGGGTLAKQLKKAHASGAKIALIMGENEWQQQQIGLKYLRQAKPQVQLGLDALIQRLKENERGF
jgi:histidyl-tRNA synthetase